MRNKVSQPSKRISGYALAGAVMLAGSAVPALSGGIERMPPMLGVLFEKGNYVELGFGVSQPDVAGHDVASAGGASTGDVGNDFGFFGMGYKHQFNDKLSAAFIVDQPYGTDITYDANKSVMYGDSRAVVDGIAYTGLLRYRLENGFAVHGGLRASNLEAKLDLNGAAYGPLTGYSGEFDSTWGLGYVVGATWERPETATRVALTYQSEIDHDFDTTESGPLASLNGKSTTTITMPRSWALDAQTGIAPGTLLMGSVRWVKWSEFRVDPQNFIGVAPAGLVNIADTTTYTIGVARKFTDQWSGAASFMYESPETIAETSLSPTNGRKGITLAGIYTQGPIKVTSAVSYVKLGDTDPATGNPSVARATFDDSSNVVMAVKVGYSF